MKPLAGDVSILNVKIKKLLDENKNPGDKVLFCLRGDFRQSLIALEDRLLIIKSGIMAGATFGGRVTTFHYQDITGIEINTGLLTGVIEITTASYTGTTEKDWWSMGRDRDPMSVSNCLPISKHDLPEYQPYLEILRRKVREAKGLPAPAASLGCELERLKALHVSGALTDAEFTKAKKKLLQ